MDNRGQTSQTPQHPLRRKDDQALTGVVDVKGISEEDKQEIYENIDRVVENNRIPITEELLTLKPKKKGAAFPITINILAIAAVGAAFFVSAMLFEQRQETLSMETEQYLSAEGKLIEQLKRESEEKLQAKDAEIGKIQNELAELDRKSADLQANMENTIKEREAELRSELEEALEAERARLQEMGASAEDIEERLAEFERQQQQQYENQLSSFRAEAEAEIRAKEEELEQARALNRDFLAQINAEKAELEEELNRREAELSAEFEAEKAALEQETSEARQKLAELSAKSENEQLFLDQLTSGYLAIKNNIEQQNYSAALEGVAALEALLQDPAMASLPGLAERRSAEQFILATLRQDIEAKTYKDDTDTTSMVQAAEALLSAREVARRGTEAFDAGNPAEAEEYYTRALASLPSLNRAYNDLVSLRAGREAAVLSSGISAGTERLAEGNYAAALEQFRSAILASGGEHPELYEKAVGGMEGALEEQRRSAVTAKDRQIAELTRVQREELETLEGELQERIALLEGTIEELNTRILEQEEALLLAEEAAATLTEEHAAELEALEAAHGEALVEKDAAYEESLAEKDAVYEELMAEWETRQAEYEERIAGLVTDIKAAGEEISGLRAVRAVYEGLTEDYLERKDRIEELLASDSGTQAENLYSAFLDDEADAIFPGIGPLSTDIAALRTRLAGEDAASEGRKGAFEDVRLYTDYLSARLDGRTPARADEITALARKEAEYSDTIMEIERLVEAAGAVETAAEGSLFRQTRFIGTVSYIIGEKIVIERLISFEAGVGDSLLIIRKSRSGRDETIAEAAISSITAQKVEASISRVTGESQPQVMDLVYLVTE